MTDQRADGHEKVINGGREEYTPYGSNEGSVPPRESSRNGEKQLARGGRTLFWETGMGKKKGKKKRISTPRRKNKKREKENGSSSKKLQKKCWLAMQHNKKKV